ncbi:MAG: hypothetical protein PHT94_01750 [Candidatus Nanoarchaeia archaeon]|nr:hypothetical protein [Candidatus Nanoarchaeia archaeon]
MIVPIEIIEHLSTDHLGAQYKQIFEYLNDKINISEFDIAAQINKTINETRAILYQLTSFNLVSSRKKKDPNKGWYVHYWSLNPSEIIYFYRKSLTKQIEELQNKIYYEKENEFYKCQGCGERLSIDEALNISFQCPECGSYLEPIDNSKLIERLESRLIVLKEKMISSVTITTKIKIRIPQLN